MTREFTEKRKAANQKWDSANLKRMSLAVRVELHERMKAHIEETGQSMNSFIIGAIENELKAVNQNGEKHSENGRSDGS